MKRAIVVLFASAFGVITASASDCSFFRPTDPLAPRDDWGLLHQYPVIEATDFAPRYPLRPIYYLVPGGPLTRQAAYVGALQSNLRRLGYYCGEIDGIFSSEVSDAIARLQKNNSLRVTGTLTLSVRRVLHLP